MSNRASPIRSHPLELSRSEDDDCSPVGDSSFTTDNQSISSGSNQVPQSTTDKQSVVSLPLPDSKPQPPPKSKPLKRIAPRLPDEILIHNRLAKSSSTETFSNKSTCTSLDNKSQLNFYIDIDQVRWFYKNDKESLQAASPISSSSSIHADLQSLAGDVTTTSEAIGVATTNSNNSTVHTSKKWHMFSKWDSIMLEQEYRDMMMSNSDYKVKLVQVLDSMYEVNLSTRKCYPIYWRQMRTMTVRRCLWFKDNEPLDEKVSDEIERKHVELFKESLTCKSLNINEADSGGDAKSDEELPKSSKVERETIGTLSFEDGTVTWYSRDEVYWGKNKPNFLDYLVGISKMGSKPPVAHALRIKRGFKDKSKDGDSEEPPREPTHLVFVIHGIAQKLYENSIIKNCEDLRKECEKKKKEHFPLHSHLKYVYLPVDWRSSLTLDDGIVETITPKSIQTIRDKLNSSALDIMYYTSPLFRSEIINSLTSELNKLYNLFCLKNPGFKMHDKVSLVAHSLGSVITYDILTSGNSINLLMSNAYGEDVDREKMLFNHFSHNDSQLLNEYLSCKSRIQEIEIGLLKANKSISPLEFKPENFFILGSPLAVFLALRGVRPAGVGSQEHILPKHICKRLFNVFHPCDPVAYRLEPLILKHYATKSPIEVQKTGEVSYKEMNERRSALNVDLKSTLSKGGSAKKKDKGDARSAELNQIKEEISTFSSVIAATTNTSLQSSPPATVGPIDQVELESAIDFQLQDSNFELVAAIRAHTGYWKSSDVGMFIIHQLCVNDFDPIKQNC